MPDANSTVLVLDDDPALRAAVARLLRSVGLDAQLFASISDFLKSDLPDGPTCLVLDVRLPGESGLALQRELAATNRELPHAAARDKRTERNETRGKRWWVDWLVSQFPLPARIR